MRTESQIRRKLRDAQVQHFKKLLDDNYKKRPHNCYYNQEHASLNSSSPAVRLCMYSADETAEWQGVICDEEFGGRKLCKECTLFRPHKTKLELRNEFNELMNSEDLGVIAAQYPDLAALMWALDERGAKYSAWQRLVLWWKPSHVQIPNDPEDDNGIF